MFRLLAWCTLPAAILLGACRCKAPSRPGADWAAPAGASPEKAALLTVDESGALFVTCVPSHERRPVLAGTDVTRLLDIAWGDQPLVAAATRPASADTWADSLVLFAPSGPRTIALGVRNARFSPDRRMLAYETAPPAVGAAVAPAATYVLDVSNGTIRELGPLVDPLWEADGRHLRATRLPSPAEKQAGLTWHSLRVRWDRESGATTVDGRGSAQIPAPAGEGLAWSEDQRGTTGPGHCAVFLKRRGGVPHSVVGDFCRGVADDRSVRWSPDGKWLAFPHPGPVPGGRGRRGHFVDIVGMAGGRWPALSDLQALMTADQLTMVAEQQGVWFDWSPTGRFLAFHDGAREVQVYDFEARRTARLGKAQRPMWSPGGGYLLVQVSQVPETFPPPEKVPETFFPPQVPPQVPEAFLLAGASPKAKVSIGQVRDARWLPAGACDK